MPTTISGPVRLPDGTNPTHGRVIFRPLKPIVGAAVVTAAPVVVPISGGAISVQLEAAAGGTPYAVAVEHWSAAEGRLITTPLPNVVPTGAAGPFTVEALAAIEIPPDVRNEAIWKRGDTISIGGVWIDDKGRPVNLTGLSISAAMRGPDRVVRPLVALLSDAPTGLIEISMAAALSAGLPLGRHEIDIKLTNGARVSRTQSGVIHIIEGVTP